MNLRSLTTRLLIVVSAFCAFAFAGDDASFNIMISSSRIYAPGDPETSVEYSGNALGSGTIYLRAFRIPDPVDFFLAQKDPHAPTLTALTPPNTFDMLRMGAQKAGRDVRYAARNVMPADARRAIRDVADLNGTKAAKDAKAAPAPPVKSSSPLPVDDLPKGAEGYQIAESWEYQVKPKSPSDDNWSYGAIPVPVRQKGVYLIEARIRGKRSITTLVISEYGMVVKQTNTQLLAFVVNSRTGEKTGDFPLTIARAGEKIAEESTDGDGILTADLPPMAKPQAEDGEEDEWRWHYQQMLVVGEKDGNFVISDPYYYQSEDGANRKVYLHTDRPVYRPAQTVYYRGILRNVKTDGTYLNPNGTDTVTIEVQDARNDVVRRDTFRLSEMGTFNGQLTLGDEPSLGTYSIRVSKPGASEYAGDWFNFAVEEYKKPEYKVVVTTDRQHYTRGDVISASVKADYFFGSPVANADVEYFVYRARYYRPWWRGSAWAYLYEEDDDDFSVYRMEMVKSDTGRLNSDGTFAISYRTGDTASQDYIYRIQANVVDNSRRTIAGAKSVEVTRGEFYISTNTDKYVYRPGDDAKVNVTMATFEGDKPVATPFNVEVVRTWWEKTTTTSPTEGPKDTYVRKSERVWSGAGSTGSDGKGSVSYKAQRAGFFEVRIAARDTRGTEITESSYIYTADPGYADWYREGSSDVQIIPDKPAYKPGETMSAMIVMPASNLDALITVEGATLYSHQVQRLNATSAIVQVPIEERHAPSIYLSAAAIVNGELYSESQHVAVVPEGKVLTLEITTDKEIYRPGEKGTVTVRALDEGGSPVSNVDVGLGVVDEAVYSIRPDATPDIQRYFYGNRWNDVSTSSSLNFSFYGETSRIDKDASDALYGAARGMRDSLENRSLGSLRNSRSDRSLAFGDVKGDMFLQPVVRKNFKDMMLWAPSVRTGADGTAKLDLNFPDNLTTWRITARGVTANTAVGQGISRVIARKNLLVRMETPRFLIQGDELLIATTVHNYLSSAKQTKVELSGTNLTMAERERTVTIPANGEQRIDWRVTAPSSGTATLTVKALTNEESDAMELPVPVLPRGMQLATGTTIELEGTGTRPINLQLPDGADPSTSELYVTLSPSLAGSMLGALDSLIGYPYGCVEQTMSRFLPTLVVADALNKLGLPFDTKKRTEIPKIAARSLSRLYGMQHDDGGWGWWSNDQTDAFMTSYVLYGMAIARQNGYPVVEDRYTNGIAALRRYFETGSFNPDVNVVVPAVNRGAKPAKPTIDPTTEAYGLFVLSTIERDKPQRFLTDRIAALARRDTITDYARALLALASSYQGMKSQALGIVNRLETTVTSGDAYAYWQPKKRAYYWQYDGVEATAYAVKAIIELKGATPITEKAIRWLMTQKQGETWHNTRQTAMVIYSLVDYMKASGETSPDYSVTVKVNGQQVLSRQMTRADIFQPEQRVRVDAPLHAGANAITIEKSGAGRLYSSARMIYYATGAALKPSSSGFRVSREYYTLRKTRRGDAYVYTKQPLAGSVKSGDEIFVKVRVTPDSYYEYVMLEDPLPAGCEVVANTTGYTIAGEREYDEAARNAADYGRWWWWYADRSVRDEKVTFFARWMTAQPYEFTYVMRAQIPGTYSVMPSVGALMYYPEVRGNGGALTLTITE